MDYNCLHCFFSSSFFEYVEYVFDVVNLMSDFKVGFESTEIKFFFNILQNITLILDTVSDSREKKNVRKFM